MILRVCLASLLFHLSSASEFDWCSLTCDGGKKHTMCVYKAGGGDSCKAVKRGLTAEEKRVLLEYHNQLRAKVANGLETSGPQPPAADMNQLVWDEEVAEIAQRWADQCEQPGGHDECRITKDKVQVGQNFGRLESVGVSIDRIPVIKSLVKFWYDEVKRIDPGLVKGYQRKSLVIGHYTQLVWGRTTYLGCGFAHKQEGEEGKFDIRIVCNYKIAGNVIGQPVYSEGEPATKCAKKSIEYPGLCKTQEGDNSGLDTPASSSSTSTQLSSSSSPSSSSSHSSSLSPSSISTPSSSLSSPSSTSLSSPSSPSLSSSKSPPPSSSSPSSSSSSSSFYSSPSSHYFPESYLSSYADIFGPLKPVESSSSSYEPVSSSGFGRRNPAFAAAGFPFYFTPTRFSGDYSERSIYKNPYKKQGNVPLYNLFNSIVIPRESSVCSPLQAHTEKESTVRTFSKLQTVDKMMSPRRVLRISPSSKERATANNLNTTPMATLDFKKLFEMCSKKK